MYKLVLLFAVFAAAAAAPAPGFLGGYGYGIPAATSYSSRVDVHHSKPIIATYAAPIITKAVVAAPVHYTLPISSYGIHETPLVGGYGYGLGHHDYGLEHGYSHGW